jgi:hypothetical protein
MLRDQEHVLFGRQSQQAAPDQGPVRQNEWFHRLLPADSLNRRLILERFFAQSKSPIEGRDILLDATVDASEGYAKNFMPRDYPIQRSAQRHSIQFSAQPEPDGDAI